MLATAAAATLAMGAMAAKLFTPDKTEAANSPIQRTWEFNIPPSSGIAEDFERCGQAAFDSTRNFFSIRQYIETEKGSTESAEARGHFSTLSHPALLYGEEDEALYCPGKTHVRTALGIGPEGKKPRRMPHSAIDLGHDSSRLFGSLNTQARLVHDYTKLCRSKKGELVNVPKLSVIERVDYTEGDKRMTKKTIEDMGRLSCKRDSYSQHG